MKRLLALFLLVTMNTVVLAANLGKTTYQAACKNCHAPQLALSIRAPAAFNKAAWDTRFEQATIESKNNPERFKTPMDYLLNSVKSGKKLMHHGGLCHEADIPHKNCANEALIQAIHYMSQR